MGFQVEQTGIVISMKPSFGLLAGALISKQTFAFEGPERTDTGMLIAIM